MPDRHVVILIDRSGSMLAKKEDTEGGLSALIAAQNESDGDTIVSLYEFDHEWNAVYTETPLADVPAYSMQPRGMTALFDAVGKTIDDVKAKRKPIPKDQRREVVVVIGTDGQENASKEYSAADVNRIITKRTAKGWTFIFLGADQDAFVQGGRMGISSANTMSYDSDKSHDAYAVSGIAVARGGSTGKYGFTDEERDALA